MMMIKIPFSVHVHKYKPAYLHVLAFRGRSLHWNEFESN